MSDMYVPRTTSTYTRWLYIWHVSLDTHYVASLVGMTNDQHSQEEEEEEEEKEEEKEERWGQPQVIICDNLCQVAVN